AGAQKKTALTGADERGRAGGGLSEAARPLGTDREPFARSPSQRSKRRTGSGHPRFPGVSEDSLRGSVQGIADRTVFPCPVFAERTYVRRAAGSALLRTTGAHRTMRPYPPSR